MAFIDQISGLHRKAWKERELGLILVFMLLIFLVLLVPMPGFAIDTLLAVNITLSVILIMTVSYIRSPLELSSFPSLLLGVTLFRLTLNIATTRLILGGDDKMDRAGNLILKFADMITFANEATIGTIIGFIIFLIFIIVQFVVITKGSGRIAEVAARFTLDAMPGKQMAIDADLNAGLIDEAEARRRREEMSRQADFYGAMDGASKFVRGEAIASLIITAINLVGGLIIAMAVKGQDFVNSMEEYTILTIGDGLVSQIPALIVSISAGLIITRGDSSSNLGGEIIGQLFTRRAPVAAGGIIMMAMGLLLGFMVYELFFLFLIGAALFYASTRLPEEPQLALAGGGTVRSPGGAAAKGGAPASAGKGAGGKEAGQPEDVSNLLKLDQLELEVGYSLIPLVDASQGGDLLERITMMRRQLALEMGLLVKPIRVRDNMQLPPNEYSIKLRDGEIAHGMALPDQFLAMDSGVVTEKIEGLDTIEPAFGLPAVWIPESLRESASLNGYTVVDATTVISTHITEVIKTNAAEILSRQTVSEMLDKQKETTPAVVAEVLDRLRLHDVQAVLKNLLREKVSVRNLESILETMGDFAERIKSPEILTEYVRARLGRTICQPLINEKQTLYCVTLTHELEEMIQKSVQETEGGSYLSLDPSTIQSFVEAASRSLEKLVSSGHHPVVLCTGQVRFHVSKLLRSSLTNVAVLSMNEIVQSIKVESLGVIKLPKVKA